MEIFPVIHFSFPVPLCREFVCKPLNLVVDWSPEIAATGWIRLNSLFISLLPGNLLLRQVRCRLQPPPRIRPLPEISPRQSNSRELAGSAGRVGVSAETNDGQEAFSAELSLAPEFGFPATETLASRDPFDYRAY